MKISVNFYIHIYTFIYRSYGGYPGPRGGVGGGPPPDNQNETLRRVSTKAGILEQENTGTKPHVCQTLS